MKTVKGPCWYDVDGKSMLLVSSEYNGNPLIMWQYDILICSEKLFNTYKDQLIAPHLAKTGWYPKVRFI